MKLVLLFSNPSSLTGKALANELRTREEVTKLDVVRKNKTVRKSDAYIRWGNSSSFSPEGKVILNNKESVSSASNKLLMMRRLVEAEGVETPEILFLNGQQYDVDTLNHYRDENGMFFIRGSKSIRYCNELRHGDLYISKPVNKTREYRVHVFDGRVIGIYEKIPNDPTTMIFKSHNCKFSKRNPEAGELICNDAAQQMCINAVNALGLTFGGVDIIREKKTKLFKVVEVNSSPSLNQNNVKLYCDLFLEHIREKLNRG